ncbi:hypothetical protein RE432_08050 [Pusillimonas sp. SM2304]|uniref:DUF6776 family protein n=1 Tax=Pusillimonas sp. SM2304 TaxID=3073241 RepID=UPI00287514F8|nr:DUF6776 family protein [Pusillimonas sp. SM2304]MDS1140387.1 hypothetical protein [Pusillimonas sp. SM2304]
MSNKDSVASVPPRKKGKAGLLVLGLLAGLVLGAAGARYGFQSEASRQYGAMKQHMQRELDSSQDQLAGARAQVDALLGQLVVEESTRKGLEASLQATQAELGRARDQLAFFDQLLPPGPKGAISIRALEVERIGPTLQYRVLLMRNAQDGAPFRGHMQFVAKGKQQDGAQAEVTLKPVLAPGAAETVADAGGQAAVDTGEFALSFDEFQRGGGLLSIPDGFTPQAVTLNVLEGNKLRVSRTVDLSGGDAQ